MSHNHSQRHVETIENLNSPNIGLTCADPDAGFYHDILPEFNAEIGFSVSPLAALSDWTESFQDVGVSQSQQLNGASPASAHAGNLEFEVLTGNGTPASDSASTSLAKISRSSVTPVWIGHTIRYGDSEAEVATSGSAKNVPNATDGKPLRIEQFNPGLGASRKRKTHRASRSDVLKHDKNPKAITKVNKIGALQGWFHIFGSNQHVRRRMNKEERTASAVTRILGACDRCRLHKQRCDRSKNLYTPCISCLKMLRAFRASGSLRRLKAVDIYLQPCIRADILGLSLHRQGSTVNNNLADWTRRKSSCQCLPSTDMPSTWAFEDKTLRIIHLTQDMGYTLTVTASTFFPDSSDTTSYSWKDSSNNTRKMEMPPYFIYDLNEAVANMQEYATLSRSSYISSLLDGHNQVACLTFEAAFRYLDTNESSLISHALSLWAATRLTERTWRVCGPYTLDFNPSTERDNPWNGIIPVTPIMDTQLDEAAIKGLLIPLKTKVLMELDRKMKQPDPKTWYEVSLALCIVLNNFEWIFADVVDYTTRHGMKKSASRGGVSLSEGYVHACKSLLSVFHFAFPDSVPFSTIKTRPIKVDDYVTAEQAEYLHSIRDALLKQGDKMADWRTRSMYETPLYWVYQLFLDDWKGDIKHITPVDNFTEEDFMTT